MIFVPYRGIYFLYNKKSGGAQVAPDFRPLSGNLLSLQEKNMVRTKIEKWIFVPYRGIYFLYSDPDSL